MKVARLTLDQVKATRDTLLRTLSRPLAAKVMVSLRSILRQAGRPFDVRLDQASDRHSERLEVGKGIPTPEQVRALLAGANQPAKAIFALAALAGLRASEIRGLAWADIKLQAAGEVTVRQRADKWGDIGPPKTGDSRRKIPIGPQLMAILEDLGPGDGLVFPTRRGTPQNLGRLRRDVIGPTRLHSLRHFYASWALSQGVPLAILQRRMGHSTITLTADHYGHLIEPDEEERARLVAAEAKLFSV
jgi:integrase